ncbi:MAG: hypothetical protein A2010_06470 [Nitrospirae bacterium GWD2_57_9]|nr:MAG: hypothetical protein A2010_06470 [Nitrospirae bacterium GWD2_57_9]
MTYQGTIIRPPSEADSLILQYTVGCSHNQCIFCPAYKRKRFRVRTIAEMEDELRGSRSSCSRARRVFLADGDALAAPQQDLLVLLRFLRTYLPALTRVGMYANAGSILGKSPAELAALRAQGIGIIYLGLESGDDERLAWMRKGAAAAQLEEAGRRVKEAGIKLLVTVLLGIGGNARSSEHARATGRLLSRIEPDHVGALTTMVVPGTPLSDLERSGMFQLPPPFALLTELAAMLEHTDMKRGLFFANHASNYLPLRVRMPSDRDRAVALIRKFVKEGNAATLMPEHMRRL